jgi:hypothetical protein
MTASPREKFDQVFAQLQNDGLLLMSDLVYLITNERIRGSWWSHKLAQTIFNVSEMLEDHRDVMVMKLISGKVTFVHRELWNHIYSIGVARADWQLEKLSTNGRRLLDTLDHVGRMQTDEIGDEFGAKPTDISRELELRLLIHAERIHTGSGKHAKVIEPWEAWAKRAGLRARAKDPVAARRFLEQRLANLNKKYNGHGQLPWPSTLYRT